MREETLRRHNLPLMPDGDCATEANLIESNEESWG